MPISPGPLAKQTVLTFRHTLLLGVGIRTSVFAFFSSTFSFTRFLKYWILFGFRLHRLCKQKIHIVLRQSVCSLLMYLFICDFGTSRWLDLWNFNSELRKSSTTLGMRRNMTENVTSPTTSSENHLRHGWLRETCLKILPQLIRQV
jgi:hypothetical protein